MTKKDYQAIAGAIYKARPSLAQFVGEDTDAREASARHAGAEWQHRKLTCVMADLLQEDNPRFDRGRFLEACETGKTRGMGQA